MFFYVMWKGSHLTTDDIMFLAHFYYPFSSHSFNVINATQFLFQLSNWLILFCPMINFRRNNLIFSPNDVFPLRNFLMIDLKRDSLLKHHDLLLNQCVINA